MAERPLLPLPHPDLVSPPKGHGGSERLKLPSKEKQAERLGPKFQRLRQVYNNAADRGAAQLVLRSDPTSLAPERVIVFEIAGSVDNFRKALSRIRGFEFIAETDTEAPANEDFAVRDSRKGREGRDREDRAVAGRVYLAMPDVAALNQLVSLWERWNRGQKMERGFAPFGHLFAQLRDLRPWGPLDRIPDDTVQFWQEELRRNPGRPVRTEVELWFRASRERRATASQQIGLAVAEVQGAVVHEAIVEEIAYHALLVDIPAMSVQALVQRRDVALALADDAMFLRPQSAISSPYATSETQDRPIERRVGPVPNGDPIAALLDGVPLHMHELLDGRVILDDPDDVQSVALVRHRLHGTAMASLVVHGDLNAGEHSIDRPLYVRPIMIPDSSGHERADKDRLFVDTLYRSVLRIKGADGGNGVAPSVFLVNLSLGDVRRPFTNFMSPLARLLDFLSVKFGLLFLVSAGNVTAPLNIDGFDNWTQFQNADAAARERAVLAALNASKHERTLLSPAEALNAVTIGAQHADSVADRNVPPTAVDPYTDDGLPNPSSALGLGHRRSLKPDLYLPGGREYLRMQASGEGVVAGFGAPQRIYGLLAAYPDALGQGRLNQVALSDGTSSATALATRACHQIFTALMDGDGGSVFADMPQEYYAVAVKALLLHRAQWNEKAHLVGEICGPDDGRRHFERSENVCRFLGFGITSVAEVLECAAERATLLGYGALDPGQAHAYRVPLPGALSGITDPRALTVTLAWFSPTRPSLQSYRSVKLDARPLDPRAAIGVDRVRDQPAEKAAAKGTIFHERFSGTRAVAFLEDAVLALEVSCKTADEDLQGATPYAIAVTIETEAAIAIYEEIRERLRVAPRPSA